MRSKGIPSSQMKPEFYTSGKPEEVNFEGLKKKNKTITAADIEAGVEHFNKITQSNKRTYNKTMSIIHGDMTILKVV